VAAVSSGFVYYVSRTGVTGERSALPNELVRDVKKLRKRVKLPLAVSYANRTELLKASTVRGHFGLTYDLDSLFNGLTGK